MPDKRSNDAQLHLNAHASDSNAVEMRMQTWKSSSTSRRISAYCRTLLSFSLDSRLSRDRIRTISPADIRVRAIPVRVTSPITGSKTKTKFYHLPLSSFPHSRHHLRSPASRNGNVPRAMKMIKRHPESQQSRSNPAPKAKSETPAVL